MSASVISLDDGQLINLIGAAKRRLCFAGPGMSLEVANAISNRWNEMGPDAVQIMIDADPEICRLGYGKVEAFRVLHETAGRLGSALLHRPGIRICLLISDDTTLVFSPTPLLVEGGSSQFPGPNAIQFSGGSESDTELVSNPLSPTQDLFQGGEQVSSATVQAVAKDLSANPPQEFDLARTVRVFNAQFEFVEFELEGVQIGRKTIPIPSDLIGLADTSAQNLLRSTFKLVGKDSEISGDRVKKLKGRIARRHLIVLPGYGTVILRANKPQFERDVDRLRGCVEWFQKQIKEKLEKEMDTNRDALLKALAPAVSLQFPGRWKRFLGPTPSKEDICDQLDAELKSAFGSVKEIFQEMKVNVAYKGVTYELLRDPAFIKTAKGEMPGLKFLHEEFDAAKASTPGRNPRAPE
jgi:hypothetical protein